MAVTLQDKTNEFLAQNRIAVVGLSRKEANPANMIYKKLKKNGHTVYAINPNAQTIEGDPCYPDVKSLPQRPDGVVIVTRPEVTTQVVHDCVDAHVTRIWIHNSMIHGGTSLSDEAVDYCQKHGVDLIAGGCPMMFDQPVDVAHACMRWFMRVTGQLPEPV